MTAKPSLVLPCINVSYSSKKRVIDAVAHIVLLISVLLNKATHIHPVFLLKGFSHSLALYNSLQSTPFVGAIAIRQGMSLPFFPRFLANERT